MLEPLPRAFFLPASQGRRFCLEHAAQGSPKGRILFIHAFAEEMNASRRVIAQQCRKLAASGYTVLQLDLLGCGDSSHDFADATWEAWLDDAAAGLNWLIELEADSATPLWIWGLRAGALLACATATRYVRECPHQAIHLLLWQPLASGRQQLQQFMRLHAAAQWLGGAATGEAPPLALAAGRAAQIAGYSLTPALANGLEQATLSLPPTSHGRVELMELSNTAPTGQPELSPWLEKQSELWRKAGWCVQSRCLRGHHFWQSVAESDLDPELMVATLAALDSPMP